MKEIVRSYVTFSDCKKFQWKFSAELINYSLESDV